MPRARASRPLPAQRSLSRPTGRCAPRILGVGYDTLQDILSEPAVLFGAALLVVFVAKLLAWLIALSFGTSGGVLAVVTRNDLTRARHELGGKTVLQVGTQPAVTVHPDDPCSTALERMVARDVGHLPVVDDAGHVVGYVSRGDILRAWGRRVAEERVREPGLPFWRAYGPGGDRASPPPNPK